MIRKMNKLNVLFMDEVFVSIQKDNINLILELLKDFTLRNKLNLILVHQGLEDIEPSFFDKVITVKKDFYSDIEIDNYDK
jgi:ABC-type multidrug transport system ATPase subunit